MLTVSKVKFYIRKKPVPSLGDENKALILNKIN